MQNKAIAWDVFVKLPFD